MIIKAIQITLGVLAGITLVDLIIEFVVRKISQGYTETFAAVEINNIAVNKFVFMSIACCVGVFVQYLLFRKVRRLKTWSMLVFMLAVLAYGLVIERYVFYRG